MKRLFFVSAVYLCTTYAASCGGSASGINSLVSLEQEPAGENCSRGGVAILSGLDLNENGVLDTEEVSATEYVCNERGESGLSVVVSTASEPPGENCQIGGIVVRSGLDIDGDGMLDPEEVTTTKYVCNGTIPGAGVVLEGSITIHNSVDVAFAAGFTEITGDLVVQAPGLTSLDLPVLTRIGKDFIIDGNDDLTTINVPCLESVGGNLFIGLESSFGSGNAALVSLTGLNKLTSVGRKLGIYKNASLTSLTGLEGMTSVGWDLFISGNASLTRLTGLEGVTSVVGYLIINDNASLTSLTGLEGVTSVGASLHIRGNAALTTLTGLEGVMSVGWDLFIRSNAALTSLTGLEGVTSVGGNLSISGNAALTTLTGLEGVESIGSLSIESNAALTTLAGLEGVTSMRGDLVIVGNAALASLTGLEGLTSVGENLSIDSNAALTTLTGLEGVTSVGGDLLVGGNWWGYGNASLTSLTGLEGVMSLGGDLYIHHNTVLCNSLAVAFQDRLVSLGWTGRANIHLNGNC